jgi:hypothetical protein
MTAEGRAEILPIYRIVTPEVCAMSVMGGTGHCANHVLLPPAPVRRTPGWINDHAIAACWRPSRASACRDTNSSS